MYFKTAIK